jgi:spermidine/putrescine-binding protein
MSSNARTDLIVAIADLFTPAMPSAVKRGLVLPLDRMRLPRIEDLSGPFRGDVCVIGDKLYVMPIYWGYTSVLYRRAAISPNDPLIDSWGMLFDDRFRGRVALRDDPHESIASAALYLGHKDPLSMDRTDLNSVKGFLIAKKRNFRALWSNLAEAVQLITTREVDAIYGQPVIAQTLASQGVDVRANLTREGVLLFVQGALIPGGARHSEYANEWLQFLFSAEVAARLTQEAGVLSPVESVRRQLEGHSGTYGYEALSAGAPLIRLGSPKNLGAWIEAWAEFKAA